MARTLVLTILAAFVLLFIAFLAMAFKVILVKGARFPMGHHAHHPKTTKNKSLKK